MPPAYSDLQLAVQAYWDVKDKQATSAALLGSTAEGTAKAVRAAGHFEPIAALLARFFLDAGYPATSIGTARPHIVLPGFFRATKRWDLVVVHRGVLVAAIELKGIGGDENSIGRNYNNRLEEAMGNSLDIGRANDIQLVGPEQPWLGYFFIMEDTPTSRQAKRPEQGVLPAHADWYGMSHQGRFAVAAERFLSEKLYDAVCYLTSSAHNPGPNEPSRVADWAHFSAAVQARINYLANLGYP